MSLQEVTAPEQYKNQALIKQLKARKETTVRVSPLNKNSFKPGENMKLRLSDAGYVDFSKSYFTYRVTGTNADAAATTLQITPTAEAIFRRMMVSTQNGQVLEDYDNRDVLHAGMYRHTMGPDANQSERSVSGNITTAQIKLEDTSQTIPYPGYSGHRTERAIATEGSSSLHCTSCNHLGFFGSTSLWPLKYMGELLFDCDLLGANALIESFVTATGNSAVATENLANFSINNVEFVYVSYEYGDQFDALVQEQIASPEGMNIKYDTFVAHVDQSNSAGELSSKINLSSSSLKGIYSLFRASDAINVVCPNAVNSNIANSSMRYGYIGGHNYRFGYNKQAAHDDTYNYQVKNRLYPSFNAHIDTHAYPELLKALARFGDVSKGSHVTSMTGTTMNSYIGGDVRGFDGVAGISGLQSGSFMLGVNLEQQGEDGTMSGIDTRGNLDVTLRLNRTSNVPIQINHFSHVDRICVVKPNNEVMIVS